MLVEIMKGDFSDEDKDPIQEVPILKLVMK
jgi:hypothetical protein